jgi:3-O-methylgallate 3,4-dioxygenase
MAHIVLAAATGHGPMLALEPEMWVQRAQDEMSSTAAVLNTLDGRFLTYADLLAERGPSHPDQPDLAGFRALAARCQAALQRLGENLAAARPDVLIVIGNDQDELFDSANTPALAIHHGQTVSTFKRDETGFPEWRRIVTLAYGLDRVRDYPGAPDFARSLIRQACDAGFDVAAVGASAAPGKGIGHAFSFVLERFYGGEPPPVVPVLVNTYTPLNRLSATRAYDFGKTLRRAIDAVPGDARVAVLASGGLSHFLCEEAFDLEIMAAVEQDRLADLRDLPEAALQAGSSEIRSWVVLAGLVEGLTRQWTDYVPVHRTPAGSGQGFGWAVWRP